MKDSVTTTVECCATDLPDGPLDVLLYDPKTGVKVWTGWFDGSAWSEGLLPADKKA